MRPRARLVGDAIERPENARALMDAAAMFGVPALFSRSTALAHAWSTDLGGGELRWAETADLLGDLRPLVVVENASGADPIFEARLPSGTPSIVLGNERRGVRESLVDAATSVVEIPMAGRGIDTLNVASAAAVALHYLLGSRRPAQRSSARPDSRRPGLMLVSPGDHVEAGSVLRSAAAFGWQTVGLDDGRRVWFGVPRRRRAEGRAAARGHRNPIRVVPMEARGALGYKRVVVAGAFVDGPPLHHLRTAARRDTLIAIPDEEQTHDLDWHSLAAVVEFGRIDVPVEQPRYRYRLVASIILAELARQVGRPVAPRKAESRHRLSYRSALEMAASSEAELVSTDELKMY